MRRLPPFRPTREHVRISKVRGQIVKRVSLRQRTSRRGKFFVIEEIKFPRGTIRPSSQVRIGYWIIGKKPRMKNRWTWGQFAPMFPKVDLVKLLRTAKKEGMLSLALHS